MTATRTIEYQKVEFMLSVHSLAQLPKPELPEIAFAGRSNVGKSSLMNSLLGRKGFVKVSGKPGKTQGLNFFRVDESLCLVDLPGYGYAKVAKSVQDSWQKLISQYLEQRSNLCCVVVIIDLRHPPKRQDGQLLEWLRANGIRYLPVYTKADKLSGNERAKNGAVLDAGLNIIKKERILFSAKSGLGLDSLKNGLAEYATGAARAGEQT
jgi:GTP-binding protein